VYELPEMNMTDPASIAPLHERDFGEFIAYLNDHLSDNGGAEAGYFQPLSRSQSVVPADRQAAFRSGLAGAVGAKGWRRAWVARTADGRIVGHIDLRAHAEGCAEHRCLLGMGVDRHHRRTGLGSALIALARQWATDDATLEWIDLQVLGHVQDRWEIVLVCDDVAATGTGTTIADPDATSREQSGTCRAR
jgi:GNAT superfamily N-acetyltransferase